MNVTLRSGTDAMQDEASRRPAISSAKEISNVIISMMPQKPPFLFLDEIVDVGMSGICGVYRFRHEEWFYRGHFPGKPVTPGVILIEAMAQTCVVAFGIYLLMTENPDEDPGRYTTLFTDVKADFQRVVHPGTKVVIKGEKVLWRRRKLIATSAIYLPNDEIAATATLSGMGVRSI
ncbi:MAG: beta-hydroxyacyl-ACP dehydratase [Oligoflexales bacterium]|nr:beta-hydroxyacyl-ACP dehydratase [Oligoflexales bacterium]